MKKIFTLAVLALALTGAAPRPAVATGVRNGGWAHAELAQRQDLADGVVQYSTIVVDVAEEDGDTATVRLIQRGVTCRGSVCGNDWTWSGDLVVDDQSTDVENYPDSKLDFRLDVPVRSATGRVPANVEDGSVHVRFDMEVSPDSTKSRWQSCTMEIERSGQARAEIDGAATWTAIGEWTVTRTLDAPKAGC